MDVKKWKINKQNCLEIAVLFLLSLLPLWWLRHGEVVMGHDSGFRLNFLTYYKSLFYAWNPVMNFGIDWQLYKGFLMTQFPEFLVTILTGSWVIGQRIMMVGWFFVIQLSMYILVRTLRPEKEHWLLRLSTSTFYAFNFFILQAWFIVERAKFSLYAAIPIALLLFYRVYRERKSIWRQAIAFGFLYFFMGGGGSPPLYGATLVVWSVSFFFFTILAVREKRLSGFYFSIRVMMTFGLVFFLINAYWIIPQIGLYLSTYTTAVAERGGVEGLLSWERVNSKNASIMNLLRLQGVPDWYDNVSHAFSSQFLHSPLLITLSFVPFSLIFFGVVYSFWKKLKHPPIIFLFFLFLSIGLVLGGGSHPPFGIFYEYAMRHLPGFAIFRSSFYKFGPIIWFSVIFLSMYFLNIFFVHMVKQRIIRFMLGVGVILFILGYHYPFFTADFFQFHKEFTTKVQVPSYVENVSAYINRQTDPLSRILVLPELTSSFYNLQMDAYQWKFFSLDILPRNCIDRSIIANDTNAPEVIRRLYTEFMDGTKEGFIRLAGILGIRYVLWRDDAKYSDTVTDGRTIAFQKEKLHTYFPNPAYQNGAWQLYDIVGVSSVPLVSSVENLMVTHHQIKHPSELLLHEREVYSAVLEGTILPETMVEADCLYCEAGIYEKMVRNTPLLTLRFKPGSFWYQRLVDSDQNAIDTAGNDAEALFNALISHSQFQLAILRSEQKPAHFNAQALVLDIEETFLRALTQVTRLMDRQQNVYATRLLLYLDVSKRFLEMESFPESEKLRLSTFFDEVKQRIHPLVWMTEDTSDIRYEFELETEGEYEVIVTNVSTPLGYIEIDNKVYSNYQLLHLTSGYHTARMLSPQIVGGFVPQLFLKKRMESITPSVSLSFQRVNPTRYKVHIQRAIEPYVLVLNESFDSRWRVYKSAEKTYVQEELHGKINGFANGWYMDKTGEYTLEIIYAPQKYFYIGTLFTTFSICIALFTLLRKKK